MMVRFLVRVAVLLIFFSFANCLNAQLEVVGSLPFDTVTRTGPIGGPSTGPYQTGFCVNNHGLAATYSGMFVSGTAVGTRAERWDGQSFAAEQLATLGDSDTGWNHGEAYAVNDAGSIVGSVYEFEGSVYMGRFAVRWDADGSLFKLGTSVSAERIAVWPEAYAISNSGTIVGRAWITSNSVEQGYRAVRWDAAGNLTELGTLGLDSNGKGDALAYDLNENSTVVGFATKYESFVSVGTRAVRWNTSETAATELGTLGVNSTGYGAARAYAVNEAGTAVGQAEKFVNTISKGRRAVRWDANSTEATELEGLGGNLPGNSEAVAINRFGTAVGWAEHFTAGHQDGIRAVRWDATGTSATELGTLTTGPYINGTMAYALNDAGLAVGYSYSNVGRRAVVWGSNAVPIDLNTLGVIATPAGGSWVLGDAYAISPDGWVVGDGAFTPVGGTTYTRNWVAQVGLGGTWTDEFTGKLDGNWGHGPQWSTGTPAMQVGDATFTAQAAYTIDLDRNERTRSIRFENGKVTLELNGHSLTSVSGLWIGRDAQLEMASSGTSALVGNVSNSGTLALGESPDAVRIEGDYLQTSSGRLRLDLASATSLGSLVVKGTMALNGSIEVTLSNDFMPTLGSRFDLLDWGGLSGSFASLLLPSLTTGLSWNADDLYTDGSLTVVAVPEPSLLTLLCVPSGSMAWRQRRRRNWIVATKLSYAFRRFRELHLFAGNFIAFLA